MLTVPSPRAWAAASAALALALVATPLASTALKPTGITGGDKITTYAGQTKFGTGGFSGDGGPASKALLSQPAGLARDPAGNLYIADTSNERVRKIDRNGKISTIAGGGPGLTSLPGPALQAQLNGPDGVAADTHGNVYVTSGQFVYKITPGGTLSLYAGNPSFGYGFSGDGGPATQAQFGAPDSLAVDSHGNVYVSDRTNDRIRKITTDGIITTFAGSGHGFGGDGGPATKASLDEPAGIAFDSHDNLYIADRYNGRIRKVTPDGKISSVAGGGAQKITVYPNGTNAHNAYLHDTFSVAVDKYGNVYATYLDAMIVKIDTAQKLTTVAGVNTFHGIGDGGRADHASLSGPRDMVFDNAGNLYVVDNSYDSIRKIWYGTDHTVTPKKTTPKKASKPSKPTGPTAASV